MSLGSEEKLVFTPSTKNIAKRPQENEQEVQRDLEAQEAYHKFVQQMSDNQKEESSIVDGYASHTPARKAHVSKLAAVHFAPYRPSPQPMTPQDQQGMMDFEEYRMSCQIGETQALLPPSTLYTKASDPPPGSLLRGPITRSGHVPKIFIVPRVGGLDNAGPWTGNGMGLTNLSP